MTEIEIKRVYETPSPQDGCRVLVDRMWPRGMRKENLPYDIWAKELAPSPVLRRWYHADPETRWSEFVRRYRAELKVSDAVSGFIGQAAGSRRITLLYAARDTVRNHARILKTYLQKQLV